ncbi:MAG: GntR family transcriptional regulator [Oscillospiraceae bacterium]|nr:GntR family transcriptional regulator [Oscillospiraceae bacterium]
MIQINYRDPRPVYVQIMDEIRKLMISGALAPDEKLPSVRDLARQLAINPNTIQRAYRELEQSGYIYSVPGKGNFAGGRQEVDAGRKAALLESIREAARELRYLGVTEAELVSALRDGEGEGDTI